MNAPKFAPSSVPLIENKPRSIHVQHVKTSRNRREWDGALMLLLHPAVKTKRDRGPEPPLTSSSTPASDLPALLAGRSGSRAALRSVNVLIAFLLYNSAKNGALPWVTLSPPPGHLASARGKSEVDSLSAALRSAEMDIHLPEYLRLLEGQVEQSMNSLKLPPWPLHRNSR